MPLTCPIRQHHQQQPLKHENGTRSLYILIPSDRAWLARKVHHSHQGHPWNISEIWSRSESSPLLISGKFMRGEWLTTVQLILIVSVRRSHWFHTIMILPADLDREFNNLMPAIKKRTSRFAILGLSLSTLLDMHQPQDLLWVCLMS